jgi:predicted RNA methylase
VNNLRSFRDLAGQTVIHVGAGGGQLIDYTSDAISVLAVDSDRAAVNHLLTAIEQKGLDERFKVVHDGFSTVRDKADVVFFEFCLHEMDEPREALRHAQTLATDIVVVDHLPESSWAWHTCEEEKAARSWAAVRQLRVTREASFSATQRFANHEELLSRVEVLGEQAISRSRRFLGQQIIEIEMGYAMALIHTEE